MEASLFPLNKGYCQNLPAHFSAKQGLTKERKTVEHRRRYREAKGRFCRVAFTDDPHRSLLCLMWTLTSTVVSESALTFMLHLTAELIFCTVAVAATHVRVCAHTHTRSLSQLSTHNYVFSRTRKSTYCLKYKHTECRSSSLHVCAHTLAHTHSVL